MKKMKELVENMVYLKTVNECEKLQYLIRYVVGKNMTELSQT